MLIIFSGLPGTGKTTIARHVARVLRAVYVRVDSLEQALVRAELVKSQDDAGAAGYMAGYALAADNLRVGISVVADSVNPLKITRDAWRDVAVQAGVAVLEIEIICSNVVEHRARIEHRLPDISGHVLPHWRSVVERDYDVWDRERLILDTAQLQAEEAAHEILQAVHAFFKNVS